jgi:NAD(P)-dependent dehydrogenase (short-subunit alcohol dehydrogenase family)
MLDLAGRGALLVGTKRVGEVVARRLAKEGVNLAIAYRSSEAEARRLQAEVEAQAVRCCVIQGDAAVEQDVQRVVGTARRELDGLSFMVNLASDYLPAPFATLNADAWDASLQAARATYLLTVHAARAMLENPGPTRGHVILFGDWAAMQTPYRGYLPYLTAKAAIHFMTRAFAVELAPNGILVNAIAPGPTARPPELSDETWQHQVLDHALLRRESSANEIAEMVVTLLRSETITGETIRVDSGRHLAGPGAVE